MMPYAPKMSRGAKNRKRQFPSTLIGGHERLLFFKNLNSMISENLQNCICVYIFRQDEQLNRVENPDKLEPVLQSCNYKLHSFVAVLVECATLNVCISRTKTRCPCSAPTASTNPLMNAVYLQLNHRGPGKPPRQKTKNTQSLPPINCRRFRPTHYHIARQIRAGVQSLVDDVGKNAHIFSLVA